MTHRYPDDQVLKQGMAIRPPDTSQESYSRSVITDDLEALLATLPPDIHDAVNQLENRSELLEIVLDIGRLAEGRFPEGEVILVSYQ